MTKRYAASFRSTCPARPHPSFQEWDELQGCFLRRTLSSLGLVVQLGHPSGLPCNAPRPGHKHFVVIHATGIRKIRVQFCGCKDASARHVQLLRYGWFPGSVGDPQTAATLQCLRDFHVKNLQSAKSAYDYYASLELLTDAARLSAIPVSYALPLHILQRAHAYRNAGSIAHLPHHDSHLAEP